MTDSPYLFRAADHPLVAVSEKLRVREAHSGTPEGHWCETGHSIFILSGRIRYRFDDHVVEAGPGDMLHIPAGPAHRHKPQAIGEEPVRYVLTEFG
jgi:mannose-6-phosphate isomerase-like protein (cupin superfamily)